MHWGCVGIGVGRGDFWVVCRVFGGGFAIFQQDCQVYFLECAIFQQDCQVARHTGAAGTHVNFP